MHKVSPEKASGGGDVLDQKSQRVCDVEKLMDHLQNTLVSIEEENLHSNKKLQPIQGQYYNLRVRCNEDKCGEVEKDHEVEEKKGEEFSSDRRDSHLVQEDNILKHDHLEKQKPSDKVVLLHEDPSPLPKELDQKPFANSQEEMSFDTVAWLQKENRVLRESLEQSSLVSMKVLGRVENLTEQQVELERCLFTLQTEKSLLQDEMRTLHQEYISLCQKVKLQLREGATSQTERDASGLIQNPRGSTHHSPPQRPATLGEMAEEPADLMTDDP
ncbi:hypothetical protein KOW79_022371 [Hemibagrus wyckioides]|uniref:Uncharacterized protein n=1 Tax=Hemibagrus wyckioides TaxID=337641 RepID=A0A9D3N3L5_9TELE|nr:uncharacterized protein si:dkey-256e7.8 [Hemibagrus wyckioides]XP_058241175.1 uncharacterized protein si:dkey-256e7.8 [Hemibagrus wyckioides]KAG7313875.1 hypothetical protein KOW79_022371 [Hemibagrus wyckioides]